MTFRVQCMTPPHSPEFPLGKNILTDLTKEIGSY